MTILLYADEMVEVGLGMLAGRDGNEVVGSDDILCTVAERVPWVSGCAFSTPVQY